MYNRGRAIGCVIGYTTIIKAVRYIGSYQQIPSWASAHARRVLKVIYGRAQYNSYRHRPPKLRRVV